MDKTLRMIEDLYEGDGNAADRIREERPDLVDEFESMGSLRSALNARPRRRPDPSAVDAVLKAAARASEGIPSEASSSLRRRDRKPSARRGVYLRSAGVATAIVTVLIAVTTVWQAEIFDEMTTPASDRALEEETLAQDASPTAAAPRHAADAADGADANAAAAELDRNFAESDRNAEFERSTTALGRRGAESDRSGNVAGDFESDGGIDPAAAAPAAAGAGTTGDRSRADDDGARRDKSSVQYVAPSLASQMTDPTTRTYRPIESGYAAALRQTFGDPMSGLRPSDIPPVGVRPQPSRGFNDEPAGNNLVWDQVADVVEMYQQIEMIEEGVARGWEPPSVPLEMVPTSQQQRGSRIQPAGDRRMP